jgi:transcriptional regulator GlxA family with amidase domain
VPPPETATLFEFVLIDAFSMMSVITAIEALRVANRILGQTRYRWRVTQESGAPPLASNGLALPCTPLDPTAPCPAYLFVCAGMHATPRAPKRLYALLRRRLREGAVIGAVSLGPLILARAGLLDGRRCVIHWEGHETLVESFPDLTVSTGLFEIDGPVMTSCGGLATLDLFLEILRREHEGWLVQAVSNQLQIGAARRGSQPQHGGAYRLPVTAPPAMHKAIALIDQHIAEPLTLPQLAAAVGTSRRTLDRRFRQHTGQAAAAFCLKRRLERAEALLLHSGMPIGEIALATGFPASAAFAAAFRKAHGITPSEARRRG